MKYKNKHIFLRVLSVLLISISACITSITAKGIDPISFLENSNHLKTNSASAKKSDKLCGPVVEISPDTPASQTICLNGVPRALTVLATGTGTLTYQWYRNTTNSNTGGILITSAKSSTYNPPTSSSGTRYYYVVVSDSDCTTKTTSSVLSVTTTPTACAAINCSGGTANIPPNGTRTINGINITSSSTGTVTTYSGSYSSYCSQTSAGSLFVGNAIAADAAPWAVTLNFSQPVNSLVLTIAAAGTSYNEKFYFTSNGGSIAINGIGCFSGITGNSIYSGEGAPSVLGGGGLFVLTASEPFTTLNMSGLGGASGSLLGICSSSIVAACPTRTPILNDTTAYNSSTGAYTIPCGSTTANLSVLTASNTPPGSVITWHTSAVATAANRIASPTAVSGTTVLYAAFYSAAASCYSPTRKVTIVSPICAVNDDYTSTPVVSGVGGTLGNIYSNDTYGGTVISTMPANSVDWYEESWNSAYATIDSSGNLTISPSTPAGTYTYYYRICDKDADVTPNTYCSMAAVIFKVEPDPANACFKPATTTGTVLETQHGITSLNRAGNTASDNNWPMVRKGAWTVLESKTKGLVVNRLTTAQIANIPSSNLVEGMIVYNTTLNCLQINTTGTPSGWSCMSTPTCPSN